MAVVTQQPAFLGVFRIGDPEGKHQNEQQHDVRDDVEILDIDDLAAGELLSDLDMAEQ